MTYAKLSGSLLARKDEPATPSTLAQTISVPPAAPPPPVPSIAPAPLAGERAKLLAHHLRTLKLPTFLADYERVARQCAAEGLDHSRFLLRLAEMELYERERQLVGRRVREAKFPTIKDLESFDFAALPSLDQALVLDLARCEYIGMHENVIAIGNAGTGKTHIAVALGLAACRSGKAVRFTTAGALVRELLAEHAKRRLMRLDR